MKNVNWQRCIIHALAFLVLFCIGCGKKQDIVQLQEPERINVSKGSEVHCFTRENEEYKKIYSEIKKCWEESLVDGALEFELLMRVDEDMSEETRITFFYDEPIVWTMYGENEGRRMEAYTYSFFPFDDKYGMDSVVSEKESYNDSAFIVKFHTGKQLKELIYEILQ